MKIGDRYIYESPIYKKLVIQYIGEVEPNNHKFNCIECKRESFITSSGWKVGMIRSINLDTLRRLWRPYNKSENFNNLYERLCGSQDGDIN